VESVSSPPRHHHAHGSQVRARGHAHRGPVVHTERQDTLQQHLQRCTSCESYRVGLARGDRKWSLNDQRIPNFRGVRVHASTGYDRVQGNRRASRNGRVSELPVPNSLTLRFATFASLSHPTLVLSISPSHPLSPPRKPPAASHTTPTSPKPNVTIRMPHPMPPARTAPGPRVPAWRGSRAAARPRTAPQPRARTRAGARTTRAACAPAPHAPWAPHCPARLLSAPPAAAPAPPPCEPAPGGALSCGVTRWQETAAKLGLPGASRAL
jgi:hypothetical protein